MAWPTPQDYNEALQAPRLSFQDPDLRSGTPELTALGLPRPITGSFASVYRVQSAGKSWAVRCFLREVADHRERYAAISQALGNCSGPYTVGFQYLEEGIRVRGRMFPIVKMEWVEGEPLDAAIRKRLHDPAALRSLASAWLRMAASMEKARIVHGDLQHGNVLVVNDGLKLVDYDGMYVPALGGRFSLEMGHRNYQHPARNATDFGSGLDRFSHHLVYLALLALAEEPELWDRYGAGDESILFRQSDFLRPEASPLLDHLCNHPNLPIRQLANRFQDQLSLPVPQLAPLSVQPPKSRWRDAVVIRKRPARVGKRIAPVVANRVAIPAITNAPLLARSHLVVSGLLLVSVAYAGASGLMTPYLAEWTLALVVLLCAGAAQTRYLRHPAVRRRQQITVQIARLHSARLWNEPTLQCLDARYSWLAYRERNMRRRVRLQCEALEVRRNKTRKRLDATFNRRLTPLENRLKSLEVSQSEAHARLHLAGAARAANLELRIMRGEAAARRLTIIPPLHRKLRERCRNWRQQSEHQSQKLREQGAHLRDHHAAIREPILARRSDLQQRKKEQERTLEARLKPASLRIREERLHRLESRLREARAVRDHHAQLQSERQTTISRYQAERQDLAAQAPVLWYAGAWRGLRRAFRRAP